MGYCKLTICFENPFWIGLVETEEAGEYRVARHVFGAEPTDPQIEQFIHEHWNTLRFSSALQVEKQGGKKINPKRLRRIIEKEIAANARKGTKAQIALAEEREAQILQRKKATKAERKAEEDKKRALLKAKHKAKHKGH